MGERALTDISYLRDLAGRYGFRFSKGLGQNFLVNPAVCPRMALEACPAGDVGVLEIGPGMGVLTRELSRRAAKVVAVEVDTTLRPLLAETLAGYDNTEIVYGDAMKMDLTALAAEKLPGLPLVVCANLPYYITSPVVMKLLEERVPARDIVVMVQREAAVRISAPQGSRASGAISLAVAYYAGATRLFDVQPGSFYPPPKVVSSVVRITPHPLPPVTPNDEKAMFRIIRGAFSQRRKTAANAISAATGLPKDRVARALAEAGAQPGARPETLTLAQYAALSDLLAEE